MSRFEYGSLRSNAEVISKAAEGRPEYSDSWMEEVQVAQQERK